jgi:hypothetical protein
MTRSLVYGVLLVCGSLFVLGDGVVRVVDHRHGSLFIVAGATALALAILQLLQSARGKTELTVATGALVAGLGFGVLGFGLVVFSLLGDDPVARKVFDVVLGLLFGGYGMRAAVRAGRRMTAGR